MRPQLQSCRASQMSTENKKDLKIAQNLLKIKIPAAKTLHMMQTDITEKHVSNTPINNKIS